MSGRPDDVVPMPPRSDYVSMEFGKRLSDDMARVDEYLRRVDARLTRVETTPIDLSQASLPTRLVVGIVVMCLTIASIFWFRTDAISANVAVLLAESHKQAELAAAAVKLQEEREQNKAQKIEALDKKTELLRIKIDSLTETMLIKARR